MGKKQQLFDTKARRKKAERLGRIAEWIALVYLIFCGYWPLAVRYKTAYGEIDLILKRGTKILFVEVKYRKKPSSFENAILPKQQKRIVSACIAWMSQNDKGNSKVESYQIDALFITPSCWPQRLKNILYLSDYHINQGY